MFPAVFTVPLLFCVIGVVSGAVTPGSPAFEAGTAVVMLATASWFGVNGVGLAWGVTIARGRRAAAQPSAHGGFLLLIGLVAAVFLLGLGVFGWAAAAAWSRSRFP